MYLGSSNACHRLALQRSERFYFCMLAPICRIFTTCLILSYKDTNKENPRVCRAAKQP